MLDITAIILTFNEERHIERCVRSAQSVATRIIVVDSYSTDCTLEIARSLGAETVQHQFKNQADQLRWAMGQYGGESEWLMRLDADEYLEPGLVEEIKGLQVSEDVGGIYTKLKIIFMGRWIRYGGFYPLILLRIWRNGKGHIEQRWMDEHMVLEPEAKTITLKENLVDDNRKGITFWVNKHNSYATREMVDLLMKKYFPGQVDSSLREMQADPQARWKRLAKDEFYGRLPLGLRAFLYFIYRYVILLGFLDGKEGLVFHFLQGFWYRFLVDLKVREVENTARGEPEKIREVLRLEYGIEL